MILIYKKGGDSPQHYLSGGGGQGLLHHSITNVFIFFSGKLKNSFSYKKIADKLPHDRTGRYIQ